tara:strand:- start:286 stop:471 length:186 start_codon:yes stop_codon:yes gene_type:complete
MKKKKKKKTKKIKCIDCGVKTDNYYTLSINSGKIHRCVRCHENNVLRSTRYDVKFSDLDEK